MDKTEISLEFDKIKTIWADCALTEAARKAIQDTHMILSETELAARLRETTESRQMLEKCGTPPLVSLDGIEELLAAGEKGQCLMPPDLEKIATALVAVNRLKDYLARGKSHEIPWPITRRTWIPWRSCGNSCGTRFGMNRSPTMRPSC